jgi:hypothetical protein
VVKNPNEGVRLVSNLMRLNDSLEKDTYRLPDMRRIIKTMADRDDFR